MAGNRRDIDHKRLSEDHYTKEIEVSDVLHQVRICMKRNVVEMFSSLGSKIHLCDRLSLLVKDSYLYLISYLSKERHAIKTRFNRDEYDNDISLEHQLHMNGSLLYIKEKIEQLKVYSEEHASFIDDYEDELKSENYVIPNATVEACEDYFTALLEMNRRADTIIKILQKLRKKAVETRNAIVTFNLHLIEYFNEKKEAGKFEEVQVREATRVVIFGNDGEIYTAKFQHEGVNAKLVFYQVRLGLEDIMGDDEE